MENKLINILTICRKAGGITTGFDPVKEETLDGKISVILLASDISEKSEK
jgi:ribosomal protein L7Ae-like RNA K-turn-binding protein